MSKFAGLCFFILLLYLSVRGSIFPAVWNNPHQALLGIEQSFLKVKTIEKPNLGTIAAETYSPFFYTDRSGGYYGLIKIALENGQPAVSGLVFKENQSDQLSLLTGKIVEQGSEYRIDLSTKAASALFGTEQVYNKALPFTGQLVIAKHPERGIMLIPPSLKEVQVNLYTAKSGVQKMFTGAWRSRDKNDANWKFNLQPLRNNQLTGTIEMNTPTSQCTYSAFAFPATSGGLWIFTGAWSSTKGNQCSHHAWFSDAVEMTLYKNLYPLMAGTEELELNR